MYSPAPLFGQKLARSPHEHLPRTLGLQPLARLPCPFPVGLPRSTNFAVLTAWKGLCSRELPLQRPGICICLYLAYAVWLESVSSFSATFQELAFPLRTPPSPGDMFSWCRALLPWLPLHIIKFFFVFLRTRISLPLWPVYFSPFQVQYVCIRQKSNIDE